MPNQHTTAAYLSAKEYAAANPSVMPAELRAMFDVNHDQSNQILRNIRRRQNRESMPPMIDQRTLPRNREMAEQRRARVNDAIKYARENPHEHASVIAERFRVPTPPLTAVLIEERAKLKAMQPTRKPMNRLFAWIDGVMVGTHTYRGSSKFERCEGVKV